MNKIIPPKPMIFRVNFWGDKYFKKIYDFSGLSAILEIIILP